MKRVSLWSNVEIEFNKELTISELIKKYSLHYTGKEIDREYLIVAQPLILDNDLNKRITGEIENFANKRPIAFRYGNLSKKNIIDYKLSTKESFIEYSNDIGMNISSMREIHFILLFHLCVLCLVGDLTDSEKLKDKSKRLFNRLKNMLYKK